MCAVNRGYGFVNTALVEGGWCYRRLSEAAAWGWSRRCDVFQGLEEEWWTVRHMMPVGRGSVAEL